MLRCVALVRTDVSEERIAPLTRVTRSGELGTLLTVTSNRSTLQKNSQRVTRTVLIFTFILEILII
jgi:hypothetical protein